MVRKEKKYVEKEKNKYTEKSLHVPETGCKVYEKKIESKKSMKIKRILSTKKI